LGDFHPFVYYEPVIKIAELPFLKAVRLSVETRDFPSLSCDKFGFISFLKLLSELYVKRLLPVNGTEWYRMHINRRFFKVMGAEYFYKEA